VIGSYLRPEGGIDSMDMPPAIGVRYGKECWPEVSSEPKLMTS
jgi:hypothetical protein